MSDVVVVGGGLAGCEAAWMLARRGFSVELCEMRPAVMTPAHRTGMLAELVCSNSLRSANPLNAVGLLKNEMRALGSLTIEIADSCAVPAGDALAVDRNAFSAGVTERLSTNPLVEIARREIESIPAGRPVIVATGPLTSEKLSRELASTTGAGQFYFYDAIAPVVSSESLDMSIVFAQSRYGKGGGDDYLNCPMNEAEYCAFRDELLSAETVPLRIFEKELHFSGCMPIEAIASSGAMALAHGPLKPVGLVDPRTGARPFAVLQLRREDAAGTCWNLVGCQTKLTYPEQRRVFRLVPGLERAEFTRLGSMHRNTFVNGPAVLDSTLRLRSREEVTLAGQITGVEGYVESAACGMLAGLFTAARLTGAEPLPPPPETALGSLLRHATSSEWRHYQPSNVNYGLFPPLGRRMAHRDRNAAYAARAVTALEQWVAAMEKSLESEL
ncbi:methylenetetrahydrofolate--tRNA-(uracil(54)-C(5))-methyltransferase (FADH(2)-oxidizing) TrmFO [Candidatus Fermentibacteria bacterium]|nr:methylenetetrahydrofolate--tRNA-(uracil(54)-C(5))-methyltransferase (FADH(2)-oxidizing) TrmFO [Candidatus Fermentibacteria bacterium]